MGPTRTPGIQRLKPPLAIILIKTQPEITEPAPC
uniref:SFRICE_029951 n=1 Tax=Spodoptera frugiperda TaxID=7108 RepID=A0A2H1WVM4_SPOFR